MHDVVRTTRRTGELFLPRPYVTLRDRTSHPVVAFTETLTERPDGTRDYLATAHTRVQRPGVAEAVTYGATLLADHPIAGMPSDLLHRLAGPTRLMSAFAPPAPLAITLTSWAGPEDTDVTLPFLIGARPGLALLHSRVLGAVLGVADYAGQTAGGALRLRNPRVLPRPLRHAGGLLGAWIPPQHLVNAALSQLDGAL